MIHEAVIPESIAEDAENHLLSYFRSGRQQEDLCFALWRPSTGSNRTSGIITEILPPVKGERKLHGNVSFEAHYLARAIRRACATKSGIAFMHSHPTSGWQGMSEMDIVAERDRIAPPAKTAGFPLLGLTVGIDEVWSARFWGWNGTKYVRDNCRRVRIVGSSLSICFNPSFRLPSIRASRLRRTIDTWGMERQMLLANLRFGVIGIGSVGSMISEALARLGVTDLLLVDADRVEEHNLDRMLCATSKDIGRYKVDVLASHLKQNATATSFRVDAKRAWVQERDAYDAVLDCDILFSAVDRPLPKDVLNNLAYAHCIPVVFGGIRVARKPSGSLVDATWSILRVGSGVRCLRCDGQYTTSDVMLERDGSLDDPSYFAGQSGEPNNQNVFPFSLNLSSQMVLEMLRAILRENWWPNFQSKSHYSYVASRLNSGNDTCRKGCSVAARTNAGDSWSYPFIEEPVDRGSPGGVRTHLSLSRSKLLRVLGSFFGGRS